MVKIACRSDYYGMRGLSYGRVRRKGLKIEVDTRPLPGESHHLAGVAFAWHPCRLRVPIILIKRLGKIVRFSDDRLKQINL